MISKRDDQGPNSNGRTRESHDFSNLAKGRVPNAILETSMVCDGCAIVLCRVCAKVREFKHPQIGTMKDGLDESFIEPFETWEVFRDSRAVDSTDETQVE